MTHKQYYKAFWGLFGALATLPPIVSTLILPFVSDSAAVYGFPPLGEVSGFARLALISMAFLVTYTVFYWRGGRWPLAVAALIAFCGACCYIAIYPRFVMRIDLPSEKTSVHVSTGYARTPFAVANFAADSNEDMLRARGFNDEEIKKLWTYKSLTIARLSLFISYCGFILGIAGVFSFGILFNLRENLSNKKR